MATVMSSSNAPAKRKKSTLRSKRAMANASPYRLPGPLGSNAAYDGNSSGNEDMMGFKTSSYFNQNHSGLSPASNIIGNAELALGGGQLADFAPNPLADRSLSPVDVEAQQQLTASPGPATGKWAKTEKKDLHNMVAGARISSMTYFDRQKPQIPSHFRGASLPKIVVIEDRAALATTDGKNRRIGKRGGKKQSLKVERESLLAAQAAGHYTDAAAQRQNEAADSGGVTSATLSSRHQELMTLRPSGMLLAGGTSQGPRFEGFQYNAEMQEQPRTANKSFRKQKRLTGHHPGESFPSPIRPFPDSSEQSLNQLLSKQFQGDPNSALQGQNNDSQRFAPNTFFEVGDTASGQHILKKKQNHFINRPSKSQLGQVPRRQYHLPKVVQEGAPLRQGAAQSNINLQFIPVQFQKQTQGIPSSSGLSTTQNDLATYSSMTKAGDNSMYQDSRSLLQDQEDQVVINPHHAYNAGAVAAVGAPRGGSSAGIFDQHPLNYYSQGQDESFDHSRGSMNPSGAFQDGTEQDKYQLLQIRKLRQLQKNAAVAHSLLSGHKLNMPKHGVLTPHPRTRQANRNELSPLKQPPSQQENTFQHTNGLELVPEKKARASKPKQRHAITNKWPMQRKDEDLIEAQGAVNCPPQLTPRPAGAQNPSSYEDYNRGSKDNKQKKPRGAKPSNDDRRNTEVHGKGKSVGIANTYDVNNPYSAHAGLPIDISNNGAEFRAADHADDGVDRSRQGTVAEYLGQKAPGSHRVRFRSEDRDGIRTTRKASKDKKPEYNNLYDKYAAKAAEGPSATHLESKSLMSVGSDKMQKTPCIGPRPAKKWISKENEERVERFRETLHHKALAKESENQGATSPGPSITCGVGTISRSKLESPIKALVDTTIESAEANRFKSSSPDRRSQQSVPRTEGRYGQEKGSLASLATPGHMTQRRSNDRASGASPTPPARAYGNSSIRSGGRSVAGSHLRELSKDVQMRLTGNYVKDRHLCSSHCHKDNATPLPDYPETVPPPPKPKKRFVDAGVSPRSGTQHDQCPQVSEGAFSIEEVDIQEVQKDVREAACDPIELPVIKTCTIQTQTDRPPQPAALPPPAPVVEPVAEPPAPQMPPRKPQPVDADWAYSRLFGLVEKLVNLPPDDRVERAQSLERHFCDAESLDIFTEEEANYNASLLRKRAARQSGVQEPFKADVLEEVYQKARRTVEVLSERLLLSTGGTEDAVDQLQLEKQQSSATSPLNATTASLILLKNMYKRININNVLKLLIRSKKMYEAMYEIRRILVLIMKLEAMFDLEDSAMYTCVIKYEDDAELELDKADESVIVKGIQCLQRLSRRIAQFQQDHRIFKEFKFRGEELQVTLLRHAKRLGNVLKTKEAKSLNALVPVLDKKGQLQFVAEDVADNEEYQRSTRGNEEEEDEAAAEIDVQNVEDENVQNQPSTLDADRNPERSSIDRGHANESLPQEEGGQASVPVAGSRRSSVVPRSSQHSRAPGRVQAAAAVPSENGQPNEWERIVYGAPSDSQQWEATVAAGYPGERSDAGAHLECTRDMMETEIQSFDQINMGILGDAEEPPQIVSQESPEQSVAAERRVNLGPQPADDLRSSLQARGDGGIWRDDESHFTQTTMLNIEGTLHGIGLTHRPAQRAAQKAEQQRLRQKAEQLERQKSSQQVSRMSQRSPRLNQNLSRLGQVYAPSRPGALSRKVSQSKPGGVSVSGSKTFQSNSISLSGRPVPQISQGTMRAGRQIVKQTSRPDFVTAPASCHGGLQVREDQSRATHESQHQDPNIVVVPFLMIPPSGGVSQASHPQQAEGRIMTTGRSNQQPQVDLDMPDQVQEPTFRNNDSDAGSKESGATTPLNPGQPVRPETGEETDGTQENGRRRKSQAPRYHQ